MAKRIAMLLLLTALAVHAQVGHYQTLDGHVMLEGDIDIGNSLEPSSLFAAFPAVRWVNATIPYTIDAGIPQPQRITDGMVPWTANTPIKFVVRTAEPNYVHFIRQQKNGVCNSSVGMIGGEQFIRVDDGCGTLGLTHEIGHAIGLYHEQTLPDRDFYLNVACEHPAAASTHGSRSGLRRWSAGHRL